MKTIEELEREIIELKKDLERKNKMITWNDDIIRIKNIAISMMQKNQEKTNEIISEYDKMYSELLERFKKNK